MYIILTTPLPLPLCPPLLLTPPMYIVLTIPLPLPLCPPLLLAPASPLFIRLQVRAPYCFCCLRRYWPCYTPPVQEDDGDEEDDEESQLQQQQVRSFLVSLFVIVLAASLSISLIRCAEQCMAVCVWFPLVYLRIICVLCPPFLREGARTACTHYHPKPHSSFYSP